MYINWYTDREYRQCDHLSHFRYPCNLCHQRKMEPQLVESVGPSHSNHGPLLVSRRPIRYCSLLFCLGILFHGFEHIQQLPTVRLRCDDVAAAVPHHPTRTISCHIFVLGHCSVEAGSICHCVGDVLVWLWNLHGTSAALPIDGHNQGLTEFHRLVLRAS